MDDALFRELKPLLDSPFKEGPRIWSWCPVHPDGSKGGRRAPGRGGRSLELSPQRLKCWAGCDGKEVLAALRKRAPAKTAPAESRGRTGPTGQPKVAYPYADLEGNILAVKGRYEWPDAENPKGYSKAMKWRLPNGDYKDGLQGKVVIADLPLYNASSLADWPDAPVWFVEGEECVAALTAIGELAVTTASGSGPYNPVILEPLRGREVIIWPDNDEPGRKYAARTLELLRDLATRATLFAPEGLPETGDVVDFLRAGRKLDEFSWPPEDKLGPYEALIDGSISALRPIQKSELRFTAKDIRHTVTGTHAVLLIHQHKRLLSYSTMNVDVDVQRSRLASNALEQLRLMVPELYTLAHLKADLDQFCVGLREAGAAQWEMGLTPGAADDSPAPLLLGTYLMEGGGTILFGPPGKGKSWVAMLMAVSLDAGIDRIWALPQGQRRVLWVNLERPKASMRRRLRRVNIALGLDPMRPLHIINARGRSLTELAPHIQQYCLQHGIDVVWLDSISRAGFGDLREDQTANGIVDTMNRIAPSWGAIGHSPRDKEDRVFGSVHFDAGVDIIIALSSEKGEDGSLGVGLQTVKANDIAASPQQVLRLEFHPDHGLSGVGFAGNGEFTEVEERAQRSLVDRVKALLLSEGSMSLREIADALGLQYPNVKRHILRHVGKHYVETGKMPKSNAKKYGALVADGAEAAPEPLASRDSSDKGVTPQERAPVASQGQFPEKDYGPGGNACHVVTDEDGCRCGDEVWSYDAEELPLCIDHSPAP